MHVMRWPFMMLVLAVVVIGMGMPCRALTHSGHGGMPVYYKGPDDAVRRALFLTDLLTHITDSREARVVILNDPALLPEEAIRIGQNLQGGQNLVIFLGPRTDAATLRIILGEAVEVNPVTDPQSLRPADRLHGWAALVNWLSAPQVRARSMLDGVSLVPLVLTEKGEVAVGTGRIGLGVVWVVSPWLNDKGNVALREWPYFNYLVYSLVVWAAGGEVRPFADYPASPVPHRAERVAIVMVVALLSLGTGVTFILVRRYSLAHPEALARIVSDAARFYRHETADWEEVGFHRPLAGFLFLLAVGLVLFVVLMVYQQVVLFGLLLPSAQARGIWSLIVSFFNTFWLLFDWGTGTAFIKFFSQYRVDDPQQGLKYGQFFVWWQVLTGTVQLGAVALVAAFIIPGTANAFMSYFIILHALIQFPGFLRIFQYIFRSYQRQDYDQALNLVLFLSPVLTQSVAVLLLTRWGAAHPTFGPAMGGVFGLDFGF